MTRRRRLQCLDLFKFAQRRNTRYGDAGPGPKDSIMTIGFDLHGLQFTALRITQSARQ